MPRGYQCDRIIIFAGLTFMAGILAALLFEFGPTMNSFQGQIEVILLWLIGFLIFVSSKYIEIKSPKMSHPMANKCLGFGYVLMACAAFMEFIGA